MSYLFDNLIVWVLKRDENVTITYTAKGGGGGRDQYATFFRQDMVQDTMLF